ncbi:MAG: lytic transglycosylase domain-containing protein [Bacteriovoracaceae bacterium]
MNSLPLFIIFSLFSFKVWAVNPEIQEDLKQNKIRHKSKGGVASILDSMELIPTKADQNSAYVIYDLLGTEDVHQLKTKVEVLKSAILGNAKFEPFHEWTHTLLNLTDLKNSSKVASFCSDIKNVGDKNFEQTLQTYAQTICLKHYFGELEKELINGVSLSSSNNEFLEKMNKVLVRKDLKAPLARFLGRIETKGVAHNEISKIVAQAFISNQEVPSQEILKNLLITYELTTFIQRSGYNRPRTIKVFGDEFDELGRKIIASSVKNNNDEVEKGVKAFVQFYKYNSQYLQGKVAKNRILFVGRELSGNGQYDGSQKVLSLITKDSDPEVSHEALFISLWSFLVNEQSSKAFAFIEDNNLLDVFPNLSLKLKYWVAHTVELNKKKGMSIKLYNQIIEQSPLSYYSIMAIKNLGNLQESHSIPETVYNLEKIAETEITIGDFSHELQNSLVRLKLWDQFNMKDLSKNEIQFITTSPASKLKSIRSKLSDGFIQENAFIIMAGAFASNNNYIMGFNLIQQGLSEKKIRHNTYLLSSLFPNLYFDSIKKLDNEVDPIILMSLIRQESGFNPRAKSLVGARGLMQLMPTTAKMMNRKVKDNDLEKPETNLKLGIQHFKYLMKKYDNNLVYVLAAYNAGEHRVSRWQKDIFAKDETMLKTIEKIPYQETRDYVKLIFRNMYFYKMLASNKVDSEAHTRIYDINLGFTH